MEREKIHIEQAIIVEGKYDKIHLSQFVDAVIIVTNGFGIYKNEDTLSLIRHYANTSGIIILTDSDNAGNQIRGKIKGVVRDGKVLNAYVPEIFGKEKRKSVPSKEGKLGVEGIRPELVIEALEKCGAKLSHKKTGGVTMTDFLEDGFSGGKNSTLRRKELLSKLGLPQSLSSKATLEVVNSVMSFEEYKKLAEEIEK